MEKGIKGYISFVMSLTIFISCAIGNTVYAEPTVWAEVVEEAYELGDEHTEEAVETTTEVVVADEVESSSGILTDIAESIKDIFNGKDDENTSENGVLIPDEIVSESALDYEMDLSNMPDKASSLMSGRKKYSQLSKQDKYVLQEYAHVRKDTMTACEEAGYSIKESLSKAIIMQQLNISLLDTLKMIQAYGSETIAYNQVKKYRDKEYMAGVLSDGEVKTDLTCYIVKGYTADEVIKSYVTARCMNVSVRDVIIDEEDNTVHNDRESLLNTDKDFLSEDMVASPEGVSTFSLEEEEGDYFEKQYAVKSDAVNKYITDKNISVNEFEEQIYNEMTELGLQEPIAVYGADARSTSISNSFGDDVKFKTGPSIYNNGINDSVNLNTGELSVTNKICSIPGVNGLDFNLSLKYKSSAQKYSMADKRFSIPDNWSLSLPYLLDKIDEDNTYDNYVFSKARFVVLNNGVSYKLGRSFSATDEYGNTVDKYDIPMSYSSVRYFAEDRYASGGNDAKYYLKYTDGRRDCFDSNGRWIATYDRFGDSIELTLEGSRYKITDSLDNSIYITSSRGNSTNFSFPDGTSYKIQYTTYEASDLGHTVVNKIQDRQGLSTTFGYTALGDDNSIEDINYGFPSEYHGYNNPLISTVTSPSGMVNKYKYELGNVQYTEDFVIKEMHDGKEEDTIIPDGTRKFPRLKEKWIEYNNKIYNKEVYTYSYYNYTYANSAPLVFKLGTIGSRYGENCYLPFYNDGSFECSNCGAQLTALLYGDLILGKSTIVDVDKGSTQDSVVTEKTYLLGSELEYDTSVVCNGVNKTYKFDYLHRPISTYVTYTDKSETEITYEYEDIDRRYYGITVPKEIYTKETDGTTGAVNTKRETYKYDNYGNVKEYAAYDSSGLVKKETHTFDEAADIYDDAHYWLETGASYQKNNNEVITVTNTLYESSGWDEGNNNKMISDTTVKVGNSIKARTEYEYYPDCTLHNKKEYTAMTSAGYPSTGYITTNYDYAMDSGKSAAKPTYMKITDTGNPGSIITEYEYDFEGNMTLVKDGRGYYTSYAYDKYNNPVKEAHASTLSGLETVQNKKYIYNYTANTCTVTDENNSSVVYEYDKAGNLLKIKSGTVVLAEYEYDDMMRPAKYKEGKAEVIYEYDGRDRIKSEVIKEGTKVLSNKAYNYETIATGFKATEKINGDSNSAAITNVVQTDVFGRNTMVNNAGNINYYTYDMMDNAIKDQNYIGISNGANVYLNMDYTYDSFGNVLSATRTDNNDTANAVTTSAAYDMLGRMITSTDGKGSTTEYRYNSLNQVTNKKLPFAVDNNGNMVYTNYSFEYDAAGNLTEESVTSGVTNTYVYDYRNKMTQARSGIETVNYTYDDAGNMVEYKTGNGGVHKYAYDNLNRVIKYTDALNFSETYTYDNNSDMTSKKDRSGNVTNYTYDGLHRVLTESVKSNGYVNTNTYVYGTTGGIVSENAKSQKYTTTISDITKTYSYNNQGLPSVETTKIGSNSFRINRNYDTRGNDREDGYYKNGTLYQKLKYVYDNKNRIDSVYDVNISTNVSTQKAKYYYDKNDNVASAHYGNNTYDAYYYNAANLVTCMNLVDKSDKSILENFVYNYRLDGNISSKTETIGNVTNTTAYKYSNNKLINETVSGDGNYSLSYTYDNGGNRKSVTATGNIKGYTETYSYDKNNRLIGTVKNYGTTSDYTKYDYDRNGNQTYINKYSGNNEGIFKLKVVSAMYNSNTGEERFTYNGLNQLVEYENTNGKYNGKPGLKVKYSYMADGYRVSKEINGKTEQYLWDRGNMAAELNADGVVSKRYTRGVQLICDSSDRYYMHNAHGDVVESFSGVARSVHNYTAYGTPGYCENDDMDTFGYCGQQYDWETGNYYMRARYYNPDTGRFISEDPVKDGNNWYSYCAGNPVKFWDPSGLNRLYKNEIINGSEMTTDYREDLRVILSEFNGVIKVEGDKVTIGIFDKVVSFNISDYKDSEHFVNGNLHFTYSEFFDLCGIEYEKSVMRVSVTKTEEGKAKIVYSLQEGAKSIITGKIFGELASSANDTIGSLWDNAMLLSDFFDNYTVNKNTLPPVIPAGEYVVNSYIVIKNSDEAYCSFNQVVPIGIGNNDSGIKFEYWNPENTIHSNLLLNGYSRP